MYQALFPRVQQDLYGVGISLQPSKRPSMVLGFLSPGTMEAST